MIKTKYAYCTIMSTVSTLKIVMPFSLNLGFSILSNIKKQVVCMIFHPQLLNNYFIQSKIYIYSFNLCVILFNYLKHRKNFMFCLLIFNIFNNI